MLKRLIGIKLEGDLIIDKYELDEWTIHVVNSRIKELIDFNERCQEQARQEEDINMYLIFCNRVLVLVELQQKIKEFNMYTIRDTYTVK